MDAKEKKRRLIALAPVIKEILARKIPIDAQMSNAISLLVDKLIEKGWAIPDLGTRSLGIQFLHESQTAPWSRIVY